MTEQPRRLTYTERAQVLNELARRQGDHWEREQARTRASFALRPQRAVEIVADAVTEEARNGQRQGDGEPITDADVDAALTVVVDARMAAEVQELCVLHTARTRGRTWKQIVDLMESSLGVARGTVTPERVSRRYAELKKRHAGDIILRASALPSDTPAAT